MFRPHVAAASRDLSGAHVAVVADASGLAAHASSGMWVGPNEPNQAVQQDGWMSKETRRFHSRIMPAVRQHGGVVMMEALCQTGVGP